MGSLLSLSALRPHQIRIGIHTIQWHNLQAWISHMHELIKFITKLATLPCIQLGCPLLPGPLLGLGAAVAPDQPRPLRVLPRYRPPLALRLPLGLPTVLPSAGQKVRQPLEALQASIKYHCHMLSCWKRCQSNMVILARTSGLEQKLMVP